MRLITGAFNGTDVPTGTLSVVTEDAIDVSPVLHEIAFTTTIPSSSESSAADILNAAEYSVLVAVGVVPSRV